MKYQRQLSQNGQGMCVNIPMDLKRHLGWQLGQLVTIEWKEGDPHVVLIPLPHPNGVSPTPQPPGKAPTPRTKRYRQRRVEN